MILHSKSPIRTENSLTHEITLPRAVGATLVALPLALGAEPISPDRPGPVNSPDTVGPSTLQIEIGGQRDRHFSDSELDYRASSPFSIRYGLGESFELRVESDG